MHRKTILATAIILATLISCGGSKSQKTATSSMNLLVGDAPIDTLASFQVDLSDIRLIKADGSQTNNLLTGERRLDLLGLSGSFSLVGVAELEPDTFTGASVSINPLTVTAIDKSGIEIPVNVISGSGSGTFSQWGTSNVILDLEEHDSIALDIHLGRSLSDDGLGGLNFDLQLLGHEADGSEEMDEFRCLVTSIDANSNSFSGNIIDDDDIFGNVNVSPDAAAVLIGDDGASFAGLNEFFTALQISSELEVYGGIDAAGNFIANRIRIEDGASTLVEIEGHVLTLDPINGTLDLLIEEIEKGEDLAKSVLELLPNENLIQVAWDASTKFNRPGGLAGAVDVTLGMELDVRFATFSGAGPFLASGIEIEDDDVEYEGTISSVAGDFSSCMVTLDDDDPSLGAVVGDVQVLLNGGVPLLLDLEDELQFFASELLSGMEIEIEGMLSGPPEASILTPTKIKIEPGELECQLVAVDLALSTLSFSNVSEDDPFGGAEVNDLDSFTFPLTGVIEFEDAQLQLIDLASLLATNGALDLEAKGVRKPDNTVELHYLEVELLE